MARAALLLALAACLALGAHAQLPATLENSTPPAFLNSLLYVANFTDDVALATGYVGGGNFSLTYLFSEDGPLVDTGRYLSWECIGNGTHHALLEFTTKLPNGTVTGVQRMCEMAIVSLSEGYVKWAWSPDSCPTEWDGEYMSVLLNTDEEVGPCGEPAPEESPFQTGTTSDVEGELTEEDLGAAVDGALEEGEAPLEGEGAIEEEPLTDGEATA